MAMSFIRTRWCCSSSRQILSTLTSALAYWVFMASILLPAFLKKPKKPFSSSSSLPKFFSSITRLDKVSPTWPKSLVRTLFSALSEKEATPFWAATPYCRIIWESLRSIFLEKSSTTFFSASVSILSSMTTGFTSGFSGSAAGASGSAPRVRVGVSTFAASAFRVSSGIMPSISLIAVSSVYFINIDGLGRGLPQFPSAGQSDMLPIRQTAKQ